MRMTAAITIGEFLEQSLTFDKFHFVVMCFNTDSSFDEFVCSPRKQLAILRLRYGYITLKVPR